jgi:hypothetical protein
LRIVKSSSRSEQFDSADIDVASLFRTMGGVRDGKGEDEPAIAEAQKDFGVRWQAKCDTAFPHARWAEISTVIVHSKAPSPLRSAGAVQDAALSFPGVQRRVIR